MTTAQELGITEFPYEEFDEQGKRIYYEDSTGYWCMWEYDEQGVLTYQEDSDGDCQRWEYDEQGNLILYPDDEDEEADYLIVENTQNND